MSTANTSRTPAVTKAKKANLTLGVSRVDRALRKSSICKNVGSAAGIFTTAVLEEIVEDIMTRAGESAKHKSRSALP